MFRKTVIVSAVRTAVGDFGGSLKDMDAIRLGAIVGREALNRAGLTGDEVDEAVFGCVEEAGGSQKKKIGKYKERRKGPAFCQPVNQCLQNQRR